MKRYLAQLTTVDWRNPSRMLNAPVVARLARLTTFGLLLLIAYQSALLTWMLTPQPVQTPAAVAIKPGAGGPAPATPKPAADIGRWHLFGKLELSKPAPAPPPRPATIPVTQLKLELRGALAAGDKQLGWAIIADANGGENFYAIGSELPGGAVLEEIHADRIILSRNGQYETLSLPKTALNVDVVSNSAPVTEAVEVPSSLRELRDAAMRDPQQLGSVLQISPELEDGQFTGYRLQPGRDSSLMDRFGLQGGDIVIAVDGIRLTNPAQGVQALQRLSTANQVTLEIRRGDVTETVILELDE